MRFIRWLVIRAVSCQGRVKFVTCKRHIKRNTDKKQIHEGAEETELSGIFIVDLFFCNQVIGSSFKKRSNVPVRENDSLFERGMKKVLVYFCIDFSLL